MLKLRNIVSIWQKWMPLVVIILLFYSLTFSGCAMLDYIMSNGKVPAEGGSTIWTGLGKTMVDITTAAGLLPNWMGPIILGTGILGGTGVELKRRKNKKERIKLGQIIEALKEIAPEEVDNLLTILNVNDKKFYEKYIKDKEELWQQEDVE